MSEVTNPLLIGKGLPPFPDIKPEHVIPAITQLLEETSAGLTELEANIQPTWSGLVEPLERLTERIGWGWGAIEHLLSVKNSAELREAHKVVQPKVIEFFNRFSQSQPVYKAYKAIYASSDWDSLEPAQKRIVEAAIRDAELSGVGLEGEEKEKFNKIQMELAELSTNFSNHVLDATKAFSMTLTLPEEIEGLPPSLLAQAAQAARLDGDGKATPENGSWCITLDYPSYVPFMQHSRRRDLREKLYRAFVSRAANGEFDNSPLIDRILELRQQKANLLGYSTYAELSLARKMAPNVEAVEKLLEELRQSSYTAAVEEFAELKEFAKAQGETVELKHWDTAYWAERQRETKFNFTVEELRPYFPLPQVLEGLFALVKRLFGVTVVPADGKAPIWHESVRFFEIQDESSAAIAYFYLDPYSRPAEKRGGAWMNDCIGRAKVIEDGKPITRLPVAYLICNQSPPTNEKPSLMSFSEVQTLFHEFGHGLQHMLTMVDYKSVSGFNNIEWDASEFPGKFMEYWCFDHDTLLSLAKHYDTATTLSESYYQKLIAYKNHMNASNILLQVHLSLVDIELHYRHQVNRTETPNQVRLRLAEKTMLVAPLPEDNFLCSFRHVFAGGYDAGYYSYKWSDVLSADAFAAFEEVGFDNESELSDIGRRFRDTILAHGGSRHPMEIFKAFRGREPNTNHFLYYMGLLDNKMGG